MREYFRGMKLILLIVGELWAGAGRGAHARRPTPLPRSPPAARQHSGRLARRYQVRAAELPGVLPADVPAEPHPRDGRACGADAAGDQRADPGGPHPSAGQARRHHGQRRGAAPAHPGHSRLPGGWTLLARSVQARPQGEPDGPQRFRKRGPPGHAAPAHGGASQGRHQGLGRRGRAGLRNPL